MARADKIPPDPALPREVPEPRAWLRQLTSRLFALLRLMIDQVNLLLDGYLLQVAALPTAGSTHRGRILVLPGGAGVADKVYVCIKDATDTYVWKEVSLA